MALSNSYLAATTAQFTQIVPPATGPQSTNTPWSHGMKVVPLLSQISFLLGVEQPPVARLLSFRLVAVAVGKRAKEDRRSHLVRPGKWGEYCHCCNRWHLPYKGRAAHCIGCHCRVGLALVQLIQRRQMLTVREMRSALLRRLYTGIF